MLNLKQKLVEIRKEIGILQKTEKGNQGASYVDPAVILLKIREGMDKHNVLLTVEVKNCKNVQIPAPTAKNPNNLDYLSEVDIYYTWYDADSDESLGCPWHAVGSHMQDPSMAFGGGLTYSERYFLLKFFQVPTSKDDPEMLKAKSGIIEYINEKQISQLTDMILALEKSVGDYCTYLKVKTLSDIPVYRFEQCVAELTPVEV